LGRLGEAADVSSPFTFEVENLAARFRPGRWACRVGDVDTVRVNGYDIVAPSAAETHYRQFGRMPTRFVRDLIFAVASQDRSLRESDAVLMTERFVRDEVLNAD
jgi:hypothetical protein